jgi:hypothetical protein
VVAVSFLDTDTLVFLHDHRDQLMNAFVAAGVVGVLMALAGGGRLLAPRLADWWRSRHRTGRQVSPDRSISDRPYSVGIARGGDR